MIAVSKTFNVKRVRPSTKRRADPTPEEIRERAREIRENWTPAEEASRAVQGRVAFRWLCLHSNGKVSYR